jgi:hypothetical protein
MLELLLQLSRAARMAWPRIVVGAPSERCRSRS